MSVKVANSRFISFSLQRFGELYQHLLSGISSFEELGNRLIKQADLARTMRRTDVLDEVVVMLTALPMQEHQLIGQYYKGLSKYLKGGTPQGIFEQVFEKSSSYKAKSLIALAALEARKSNYESELQFFTQALKFADSLPTLLEIYRSIAVVKAKEGFHQRSINELESISPYIRYAGPYHYCQYLNSYAVELGEVGRIEEAQKVSRITLASPFAFAYPEWRETEQDLALLGYKSRSSVRVKTIPGNLLYLPEREVSDTPVVQDEDARLFDLEEWKEKKMVKEPNGDEEINPDKMTEQDMVMKLIQMLTTGEGDEKKIRELLKFALKTFYGK
jgi:tetratricopeptide (TPR) repeat protein